MSKPIWILKSGETVPTRADPSPRLMRSGQVFSELLDRGHRAVWWTSDFDHFKKAHWADANSEMRHGELGRIVYCHGGAYCRNVSVRRLVHQWSVAKNFEAMAGREEEPSVIYAAFPTVELAYSAVRHARKFGVRVVVDLRDMWPDIIPLHFGLLVRPLVRFALAPYFQRARWVMRNADALVGITEPFLSWGLGIAARPRSEGDAVIGFSYPRGGLSSGDLEEGTTFWRRLGVGVDSGVPVFAYSGSLGHSMDLSAILQASASLNVLGVSHQVVVCGIGERLGEYTRLAAGNKSIVFAGWVGRRDLAVLLSFAHAGFDVLPRRMDFMATINNKAVEYLHFGVPVIVSPARSHLGVFVQAHGCGWAFDVDRDGDLAGVMQRAVAEGRSLRGACRRVFDSHFSWDRTVGRFADLLLGMARN